MPIPLITASGSAVARLSISFTEYLEPVSSGTGRSEISASPEGGDGKSLMSAIIIYIPELKDIGKPLKHHLQSVHQRMLLI